MRFYQTQWLVAAIHLKISGTSLLLIYTFISKSFLESTFVPEILTFIFDARVLLL
jgi:hypothetical protein